MQLAFELVLAGTCCAAALVCCAGSWCSMLAANVGMRGAVMRYGMGSLTNTFLPGRAGDVVRIGLFGRVAPGGALAVTGAAATVGMVRWLALVPLGIAGIVHSTVPPAALAAATAALLPLPLVWILARRGSQRARAALAPLRAARRATYVAVFGWVCGTLSTRVAGVAIAGSALGIRHPVAAAILVVPALELAGIVPLLPANAGIAGGAAAVAFHAQGASIHAALAAGMIVHAVETGAALVVGGASAVTLLRAKHSRSPVRCPIVTTPHPRLARVAATLAADAPEDRAAALRAPRAHALERRRADAA